MSVVFTSSAGNDQPKRGRGRPPGALNKKGKKAPKQKVKKPSVSSTVLEKEEKSEASSPILPNPVVETSALEKAPAKTESIQELQSRYEKRAAALKETRIRVELLLKKAEKQARVVESKLVNNTDLKNLLVTLAEQYKEAKESLDSVEKCLNDSEDTPESKVLREHLARDRLEEKTFFDYICDIGNQYENFIIYSSQILYKYRSFCTELATALDLFPVPVYGFLTKKSGLNKKEKRALIEFKLKKLSEDSTSKKQKNLFNQISKLKPSKGSDLNEMNEVLNAAKALIEEAKEQEEPEVPLVENMASDSSDSSEKTIIAADNKDIDAALVDEEISEEEWSSVQLDAEGNPLYDPNEIFSLQDEADNSEMTLQEKMKLQELFEDLDEESQKAFAKLSKASQKDLINNRYFCSDANTAWSCDWMTRGVGEKAVSILLIVDLGSRSILSGTLHRGVTITAGTVVSVLTKLISEVGCPKIFHMDRGAAFTSDFLAEFLVSKNIARSFDVKLGRMFGNQLSESINRAIALFLDLLRSNKKIKNKTKTPRESINDFLNRSSQDQLYLVKAAVSHYNELPLGQVDKLPRQVLYSILLAESRKLNIIAGADEKEAEIVKSYHAGLALKHNSLVKINEIKLMGEGYADTLEAVYNHLVDDWGRVIPQLALMKLVIEALRSLVTASTETKLSLLRRLDVVDNHNASERRARIAAEQRAAISEAKLDTIMEEIQIQREERIKKEKEKAVRKQKALSRVKQPLRDILTDKDIILILRSVTGDTPFVKARDRVGLIMLKLFGIRVGQLRTLTMKNILLLYNGKSTEIELIKSKSTVKFRLTSSVNIQKWLKQFIDDLLILREKFPNDEDRPFCVTREQITKRLNLHIKRYNSFFPDKQWNTHCIRKSAISAIIEAEGIEVASKLAGHASIATTALYDGNKISKQRQADIYDKVNPIPENLEDIGKPLIEPAVPKKPKKVKKNELRPLGGLAVDVLQKLQAEIEKQPVFEFDPNLEIGLGEIFEPVSTTLANDPAIPISRDNFFEEGEEGESEEGEDLEEFEEDEFE